MFKFGDRVIGVGGRFDMITGIVMAIDTKNNMMTIMCEKNFICSDEAYRYHWNPVSDNTTTWAYYVQSKLFRKVEPKNESEKENNSDAKNTADQIAKLIDTDKHIDERIIIDFCKKHNQQYPQDKLSKGEAKFGGKHEAKLAEQKSTAFRKSFLKQPAVYLPDTIFTKDFDINIVGGNLENNDQTPKESKRKPNKLRKLIKKIVKTELKKMLKKAENE